MLNWISGIIDRICVVMGAVILAQTPLLMQQYTQQLIGREAELQLQVTAIRQSAALSGKTLQQLAQKFIENGDVDVVRQGELMLATFDRWHKFSEALLAMQESSLWNRPFVFLYHLNKDIFFSTLQHFKIGLPLTLEGAIYACLGVVLGYLTFAFMRGIFRQLRSLGLRFFKLSTIHRKV
jgi:hypothetical protein